MSWKNNFNIKAEYQKDHLRNYKFHHEVNDRPDSYTFYPPTKIQYAGFLIKRIWSDRKLRVVMILSIITVKILFLLAFIFLIPPVIEFIDSINREELKGVLEAINGFIIRLWNGA